MVREAKPKRIVGSQEMLLEKMLREGISDQNHFFEVAFDLYGREIFRFSFRMLSLRSEAEDATVETFFRAIRALDQFREGATFRTWLFRIARNICVDVLRTRKKLEAPTEETYVHAPVDQTIIRILVHQTLAGLPPEYREPIILCDMGECTAKEAASILRLSVPALKSRLYRGRREFRDKIGCSTAQLCAA